jgi:hypothetical protein
MCSHFAPNVRGKKTTARYQDSGNEPFELLI